MKTQNKQIIRTSVKICYIAQEQLFSDTLIKAMKRVVISSVKRQQRREKNCKTLLIHQKMEGIRSASFLPEHYAFSLIPCLRAELLTLTL